tara:strand:+ start:275 stop:436 length:162 start_codon:yes stop_codon:yes gene_type:complete
MKEESTFLPFNPLLPSGTTTFFLYRLTFLFPRLPAQEHNIVNVFLLEIEKNQI